MSGLDRAVLGVCGAAVILLGAGFVISFLPSAERWLPAILAICGAYYIAKAGHRGPPPPGGTSPRYDVHPNTVYAIKKVRTWAWM